MIKQKDTEPMDEAYKMLDGSPSATGVSDAAKGKHPAKDDVQYREDTEDMNDRLYKKMEHDEEGGEKDPSEDSYKQDGKCTDIDEAYSMLFEALAIIMKK
jgi:hypothetical protein